MMNVRAGERERRFWGALEVAIVGCVVFGCGESSRTGDTPGSGGASTHEDGGSGGASEGSSELTTATVGSGGGAGASDADSAVTTVGANGGSASDSSAAQTQTSTATTGAPTGGILGDAVIPDEHEAEVLTPLWVDEGLLSATSGPQLVDLVQAIGFARGYALCRCSLSPNEPPEDVEALRACAEAEAGILGLVTGDDRKRCVSEEMDKVPGLEAYLRCIADLSQVSGLEWLELCTDIQTNVAPAEPPTCEPPTNYYWLTMECGQPFYCADGTRVSGSRCSGQAQCPDNSDEASCFDETGHDQVVCNDTIEFAQNFCFLKCAANAESVTCLPDRTDVIVCRDGTELEVAVLCDRKDDCPEGEDEKLCLR